MLRVYDSSMNFRTGGYYMGALLGASLIWLAMAPTTALAQWAPNGKQVSTRPSQLAGIPVRDGGGGAYVMLADDSDPSSDANRAVRLQHLSANGETAPLWASEGLLLSSGVVDSYPAGGCLNFDGSISALIGGGALDRFWIQRVRPDGSLAPGWTTSPTLLARVPHQLVIGHQIVPMLDGSNLIVWNQDSGDGSGQEVFAQLLAVSGLPMPGWPLGGKRLIGGAGDQTSEFLFALPTGGATFVYRSEDPAHAGVFMCRLAADASIDSSWGQGSARVVPPSGTVGTGDCIPDGLGGYYYAWADYRDGYGLPFPAYEDYYDIYLQRITSAGQVAPGWPLDGVPVCLMPGRQWFPRLAADGSGGVFVAWGPDGGEGNGIHAQHMLASGSPALGWPVGGKQMFGPLGAGDYPVVAPDGLGGCFVFASMQRVPGQVYQAFAQHVGPAGIFDNGWSSRGYQLVGPPSNQQYPYIIQSGIGSAIVTWGDNPSYEVFAQKLVVGGPVAAEAALVSTDIDETHVVLVWAGASGTQEYTVERREASTSWAAIGNAQADGQGRVQFADRSVIAGARYAYRLEWSDRGALAHTADSWVTVPNTARFALIGATPNPASRKSLRVAFSLSSKDPARLQLFDAQGRCVQSLVVGGDASGRQLAQFSESGLDHAGIYWMRLSQGTKSATSRVVLLD